MIGREISHYSITKELGMGGMGVVYRARDLRLQRDVAIKMLNAERALRPASRARFHREAIAASALNHPNIVTIYEIAEHEGADFIVMEYVRGTSLSKLVKERPLTVEETVRYGAQVADALAQAHQAGVIHRDLKPANIMVTDEGVVKVLDFGLAKFDENQSETEDPDATQVASFLTSPGIITGTMSYMSPEQARGEKVDTRSDIFSLGIVLFELLSQRLPFDGPSLVSMLHNLHFVAPHDLSEVRHDVPKPLLLLIRRMLEKDVTQRIQSMAEVSAALKMFADGHDIGMYTRLPGGEVRGWLRSARRNRASLAIVALGLVLAAVLAVGYLHFGRTVAKPSGVAGFSGAHAQDAFSLYKDARQELAHADREGAEEQAQQMLERAVELNPTSAPSFAALTETYHRAMHDTFDAGLWKKEDAAAQQALKLEPNLAAAHTALAISKMDAGDTAAAEDELRKATDLDPRNPDPYEWLGVLYDRTGDLPKAADALHKSLQIDPHRWEAYMELGVNAYKAADYKTAAAQWEQSLKEEPDNVVALSNLSAVYHLMERDEDAATLLQRALEVRPQAFTYTNLGTIRFYQGRYAESVLAFEKAAQMADTSYDIWGDLGDAYRWAPGYRSKANPAYQRAIDLVRQEIAKTPKAPDLHANLAMYLAKIGQKEAALAELKVLGKPGDTKDPAVLFTMGIVYELCSDRKSALAALAASVKAGQSVADLKHEPELSALRGDPQYASMVLAAHAPSH